MILAAASACPAADAPGLADFSAGIKAYTQRDFTGAIARLDAAKPKLPKLNDYIAYYLAASKTELNDLPGAEAELAVFHAPGQLSPLGARALLLEAPLSLRTQQASESIKLLREGFESLPQPEGAMALAGAYEAQGERAQAAALYGRVFFEHPATQAAVLASAAMERLKIQMGKDYPPPDPKAMLGRGDAWLAAKQYAKAGEEFGKLQSELTGIPRDYAAVGLGVTAFLSGDLTRAQEHLKQLKLARSEADAQRFYYLEECARKMSRESDMLDAVALLGKHYPESVWRLKALVSAGNYFLANGTAAQYTPLFQAAYRTFPDDNSTAYCHWKVTWDTYLKRLPESADLLKEQVSRYPSDPKAASALFFLARLAEPSDPGAAKAYYLGLKDLFPHYYYGVLADTKLREPAVASATASTPASHWLNTVAFPERPNLANETPTAATRGRIERAKLLTAAGFPDWAQFELRFGADTDGQRPLLALEIARTDATPALSLRHMKNLVPEYLSLDLDRAPREFWQYLFPMPYRDDLLRSAGAQNLDPYLVAGLIRQESEFNPSVVSRARAYGLMQLIPSTGQMMARDQGLRYSLAMLTQPATSLRLGSCYLRKQIDRWNGNLEQTLAAYNAGPGRVVDWLARGSYREPAEFVESIPFTETREYVQAVLRNAFVYRKLYEGKPAAALQFASAAPAQPDAVPSVHVVRGSAPAPVKTTARLASSRAPAGRSSGAGSGIASRKPLRKKHSRALS